MYCHGSIRWRNVEKTQELAKGAAYSSWPFDCFFALHLSSILLIDTDIFGFPCLFIGQLRIIILIQLTLCISVWCFIPSLNFQAEPPTIVVATMRSLCQMLEKQILKLESMSVLIIDEVIEIYINLSFKGCSTYCALNVCEGMVITFMMFR